MQTKDFIFSMILMSAHRIKVDTTLSHKTKVREVQSHNSHEKMLSKNKLVILNRPYAFNYFSWGIPLLQTKPCFRFISKSWNFLLFQRFKR